jgi:hypothetical protein
MPFLPAARAPAALGAAPRRAWLREPLLHFVVLGALLFAADRALVVRADDPHTIVMGPEVDAQARQTFQAARGRAPDDEELAALRRIWLDNEVLYREGLAMQVDRGDTAIRERVIFKALSVVDASVKLPPADDAVLRPWFEAHRAKYDEPARFDFEEAVLAGEASEAAVRAFVSELNNGAPGDAKAGLRVFKGRPRDNLRQSYGEAFATALEQAPVGRWVALPTPGGWRAIRSGAAVPARPAQFDAVRPAVLQDWTDAASSEQRSAAVRVLARKYVLKTRGEAR